MGVVMLNVIGQCGPFLGTNIFPDSDAPRYVKGQSICAAFMFFTMLLALGLRTMLVWENRKLDKKYGSLGDGDGGREGDGQKGEPVAEENYGASYRFML